MFSCNCNSIIVNSSQAANFIVNDVSDVPVLTRARTLLPVNYLYLEESLANNGGGGAGRLAVFTRKSIPLKTQTGPIKGIAYSAKNYLHIFILQVLDERFLNQESASGRMMKMPPTPLYEVECSVTCSFIIYATNTYMPDDDDDVRLCKGVVVAVCQPPRRILEQLVQQQMEWPMVTERELPGRDYRTLQAVLLNQKDENNSNWTRFIQPVTSPQEQNIELITKEFAYTYK
ncbi:hypothetical protein TYRP_012173 [Tyrophagus putrescentiae]|nr:hypothetical protein TYRP_012173 [Tyrophagus putrescentiae]